MNKYIVKIDPGEFPRVMSAPDELTLDYMQHTVARLIEVTPVWSDLACAVPGLIMIVNEEGKLFDLDANAYATIVSKHPLDTKHGTAIMAVREGENIRPLTEGEAQKLAALLSKWLQVEIELEREEEYA